MSIELRLLLAAAGALALALALTPLAIRVAGRLEFFDLPTGYKKHAAPTPYLGGAAVIAAAMAPFAALGAVIDGRATAGLAAAAVVLWAVGTVDDRRTVSPRLRVLAEVAVATGLWALDLGWDLGAGGAVDLLLTAAWLVAVINAVNLFDNLDGASCSVGGTVAAGVAALGLVSGDAWLAALGAATAASCLGFLRFNLAAPTRIFLGDGGSMPLGLLIAVGTMVGATDAARGLAAPAVAIVLTALPLLDTTLVVVSRRRRGVSFLTGGRDHLSHRTLERVGTPRRVAARLASIQLVVSAAAIGATELGAWAIWTVAALTAAGAALTITRLDRDWTDAPADRAL